MGRATGEEIFVGLTCSGGRELYTGMGGAGTGVCLLLFIEPSTDRGGAVGGVGVGVRTVRYWSRGVCD